jgi:uncharacterized protein (TIGR02118 family)
MIKVSVLYPNKPGSHFDMGYYINTHIPLATRLLAKGLRKTEVDAGIQGTRPGEPPAFFGGCQLTADIPRYTDVAPLIQFNEVKLSL